MNSLFILPFILIVWVNDSAGHQSAESSLKRYAVAKLPTPVFNIQDFPLIFGGEDGKTLRMNSCQQIPELEFIALPKTVFVVIDTINIGNTVIYRVITDDYPSSKNPLFIDSRFVNIVGGKPPERLRTLPSKQVIIEGIISAEGSRYLWGGNYRNGIQEMLFFYPPFSDTAADQHKLWVLKGLDCSGLLYEATNGYTPRNTNALLKFGETVHIRGLDVKKIMQIVRPLDLIAWEGHVIIILDGEHTIESRLAYNNRKDGCREGGVRLRPLKDVLEETIKNKVPVDSYADEVEHGKKKFLIRRWFHVQ